MSQMIGTDVKYCEHGEPRPTCLQCEVARLRGEVNEARNAALKEAAEVIRTGGGCYMADGSPLKEWCEKGSKAILDLRRPPSPAPIPDKLGQALKDAIDPVHPSCNQADGDLREKLAALCHEQWSGWMKHLFSRSIETGDHCEEISAEDCSRWKRQMHTPYAQLWENEKESDRKEADRILEVLKESKT